MFGPWIEIYTFLKGLVPSKLRLPHLNFIMLHYIYIIGCAIVGSIIIYPARNMRYVDALFFAAGSATQSGLNPIDINTLYLYQQVTLMLIACIANPIFIHTFVVFVRLYWFEKRFQSVVLEAQKLRRTRERSRMKGEYDEEKDAMSQTQVGVGGHKMQVLRPGARTMEKAESPDDTDPQTTSEESDSVRSKGKDQSHHQQPDDHAIEDEEDDDEEPQQDVKKQESPTFTRDIKFAEPQKPRERRQSELLRLPQQRTADDHIQFIEKQRKQEDENDDVLYIPGPRDFDRGDKPQAIQWAGGENPISPVRSPTKGTDKFQAFGGSTVQRAENGGDALNGDDHPPRDSTSQADHTANFPSAVYSRTMEKLRARRTRRGSDTRSQKSGFSTGQDFGRRGRTSTFTSFLTTRTEDNEQDMPYLSYQPTMGRNSMFVNLTEEQREELGGIEYRSLKLLATFLVSYFVGFHLLGLLSFLPWIVNSGTYKAVLYPDGVNPAWWGVFTPASMFNDLGFTLTPDSMTSFQYAVWILLIGSFLIIIGNTGFPCMLRFIVWLASVVTPKGSAMWEELRFLLDHPRRCFTLLFPSKATWWLFWVLVILNGVDLIFFIILDLNDPTVTSLPAGIRVLDGWFQAASTRTAGFNVVSISNLHPAIQVSYLIMMYISVFPIAISVRRTNVYEERSLGIYTPEQEDDAAAGGAQTSYVGAHLRRQLSFDLWFVFLGLFIIAIVEGGRISSQSGNDYAFSLFAILFEIVSAYGTVGLSLGYPDTNASFSAQFRTLSKLVIVAMQIRGRHRGLPYALDKAVLLPSENLQQKEANEALRRASRRGTGLSAPPVEDPALPARVGSATSAAPPKKRRSWGFGRLLGAGLSAGPTVSKRDD